MLEDPGVGAAKIAACIRAHYDIRVRSVTFLPRGYDPNAAVYHVASSDGFDYFLKIRFDAMFEPGLRVPRALSDAGVPNVLAPLRTRSGEPWCSLDDRASPSLVLYPFVGGENAMARGLSDEQWRAFGSTLRAVHESGVGEMFRGQVREETFGLPSAGLVRELQHLVDETSFESAVAARFAVFWQAQAERIEHLLARAEALGRSLQGRRFDLVFCHGDIHAANILVGDDERITLVDWDGPIIAPRERDLFFVIGSRIARAVQPEEESLFFAGYGPAAIDPEALIYYRYERIVEDIGEIGKSVFFDHQLGERARAAEAELAMRFFAPGNDIDRAETVNVDALPIAAS